MTKTNYYLALGILTLIQQKVNYAISQLDEIVKEENEGWDGVGLGNKSEGCDL